MPQRQGDAVPSVGADGAVEGRARQDEGLVGLGAVHRDAAAGGTAVLALPGDGLDAEHAVGSEPGQPARASARAAVKT